MKIKLGILYNSIEALKILRNCKIDVVKAYNLRKLFTEIQSEIDTIEALRKELVKKHGKEIKQDGKKTGDFSIDPSSKAYTIFISEMNTLFDKEVELKELKKAQLGIKDLSGNKIEPAILGQLDWLIL